MHSSIERERYNNSIQWSRPSTLRNFKRDEEKIGSLAKANLLDLDLEFWESLAEKGNSPYGFFQNEHRYSGFFPQ
jgi:hypothetical protein